MSAIPRRASLLALVVCGGVGLNACAGMTARPRARAGQGPQDKAFVLDLRMRDATYIFDASRDRIELSQFDIRWADADAPLSEIIEPILRKKGVPKGKKLWIGAVSGVAPAVPAGAVGPGEPDFACTGRKCDCRGAGSCQRMFAAGGCTEIAYCWEGKKRDDLECSCLR